MSELSRLLQSMKPLRPGYARRPELRLRREKTSKAVSGRLERSDDHCLRQEYFVT
jgi:hypothetical protein